MTVDADAVCAYVHSCRKPSGAFGPADQEYTDAAWNYPAVQTLRLLGENVPQPEAVLQHGLGFPPGHIGHGHWHFFHQHQIRHLLGRAITPQHRRIEVVHQGFEVRYYGSPLGTDGDLLYKTAGGSTPDPQDIAADKLGYYNLSSLYLLLAGMQASGREASNPQQLAEYIRQRQAPSGGFVDVRTADGTPQDDEAHVASTFYAVASLNLLGQPVPQADRCAAFIHACQVADGKYRWHPQIEEPSNSPDIYYTWAVLWLLDLLGAKPQRAMRAAKRSMPCKTPTAALATGRAGDRGCTARTTRFTRYRATRRKSAGRNLRERGPLAADRAYCGGSLWHLPGTF